jgi:hypothetical protein
VGLAGPLAEIRYRALTPDACAELWGTDWDGDLANIERCRSG